jgi:hypothetical protein
MTTIVGEMFAKEKILIKKKIKKNFFFYTLSCQNHLVGLNLTLKDVVSYY